MLGAERADWRGGLMNYLGLVIALAIFVVIIVAYIQIITKAGLFPVVDPAAVGHAGHVLRHVCRALHDSLHQPFGTSGVTTLTNDFGFLATIDLLVGLANFVMFLVFAFSEWPVMREARSRRPPAGGMTFAPPRPAGPGAQTAFAAPLPAPAFAAPPPTAATRTGRDRDDRTRSAPPSSGPSAAPPAQPGAAAAGWYRSGALGKGEQSYWDGQTWTARRIWTRGAWKELRSAGSAPGWPGRRFDRARG